MARKGVILPTLQETDLCSCLTPHCSGLSIQDRTACFRFGVLNTFYEYSYAAVSLWISENKPHLPPLQIHSWIRPKNLPSRLITGVREVWQNRNFVWLFHAKLVYHKICLKKFLENYKISFQRRQTTPQQEETKWNFLISNFRRVLNFVFFLSCDSLASEFIRRRLVALCSIFIDGVSLHHLWRWNRQCVPKRRCIKCRRRGITPRKNTKLNLTAAVN